MYFWLLILWSIERGFFEKKDKEVFQIEKVNQLIGYNLCKKAVTPVMPWI
jgi:hypothetical protein